MDSGSLCLYTGEHDVGVCCTFVDKIVILRLNKRVERLYLFSKKWQRSLGMSYYYVYLDGIYLNRNFAGNFENVAIHIAISVKKEGECEVIGSCVDT